MLCMHVQKTQGLKIQLEIDISTSFAIFHMQKPLADYVYDDSFQAMCTPTLLIPADKCSLFQKYPFKLWQQMW